MLQRSKRPSARAPAHVAAQQTVVGDAAEGLAGVEKSQAARPSRDEPPGALIALLSLADLADVLGLGTLGALTEVELDRVVLGQRAEAFRLDGGVVDEHVLATVVG